MNRLTVFTAAALSLLLTAVASAESIWVQSENVELRSGKGAVYPVVASAPKGTELTVISRDGKWIQVQAGANQGWVYETAVSAQKVDAGGGAFSGIKPGIVKMDTTSASKGLNDSAEQYAAGKNMSSAALNQLIYINKHINPQEWEQFTQQGKVGPHRQ